MWSQSEPVGFWAVPAVSAGMVPFTAPGPVAGVRETTTDLEVGVLLPMAVESSVTSGVVSG